MKCEEQKIKSMIINSLIAKILGLGTSKLICSEKM
jgi:hypothetical protein